MSYLGLKSQQQSAENRDSEQRSYKVPDLLRGGYGGANPTKIAVNPNSALTFGAFYASVRILSQTKASLPIHLYERKGPGLRDVVVTSHPASVLVSDEPNTYQQPIVHREEKHNNELLWGDSFVEIRFEGGYPVDLQPHHPQNIEVYWSQTRKDRFGRPVLMYLIRDAMTGQTRSVDSSMMLHVPYYGFNGITGKSVVKLAASSIGIALATDKTAATFFGNSTRPFMVAQVPTFLQDDELERFRRGLQADYSGDNAYMPAVLQGGATAAFPNMPMKDAQFLESRQFSGEEIAARWFGLPPHLAGYLNNANYNTLDLQNRSFVMYRLTPDVIRDEHELNRKLLSKKERERFYFKYNVEGLLRGDQKTRYEAHRNALMSGWMTINEVRELEDMTPLPGGDELAKPAAIYGKDPILDKPADPAADQQPAEPKRTAVPVSIDIRGMVLKTVESFATAERIWLERLKPGADAEARIKEYYEIQTSKLLDRLPGTNSQLLEQYHAAHQADVLRSLTDSDHKSSLTLAMEGWRNQPKLLTDKILGG